MTVTIGEAGSRPGLSSEEERMRGRRGQIRVGAAAAAALLLAGCGSGHRLSKPGYEQKVQTVYAGIQQAFRQTNVGPADLADRVATAQEELRNAAGQLERAKPPKAVERENEEMVEGLRAYAADLDELRQAAARKDARAIAVFNDRIGSNEAIHQIAEAAEEMTGKGFELGSIAAD